MTTLSQKRKRNAAALLPILGVFLVLSFQNCSPGILQSAKLDAIPVDNTELPLDINQDTKPITTVYSESILISMQSLTGLETISTQARNAAEAAKQKISETGKADSINGPMWLSITNVAGEMCLDLVNNEKAKAQGDRRFFGQVNFSAAPASSLSSSVQDDMIRRMARNFWGRNETVAERTVIKSSLSEALATPKRTGASDAAETEDAVIYTCSAMLASLDAVRF